MTVMLNGASSRAAVCVKLATAALLAVQMASPSSARSGRGQVYDPSLSGAAHQLAAIAGHQNVPIKLVSMMFWAVSRWSSKWFIDATPALLIKASRPPNVRVISCNMARMAFSSVTQRVAWSGWSVQPYRRTQSRYARVQDIELP